ncbi:MAG: hypothetical protein WDZ72_10555 [Cyclobacteriaceae bacterium]
MSSSPRHNRRILPVKYVAYKTAEKPLIDGRLNETFWKKAPSSDPFVDIRGEGHSSTKYLTQMKMIWELKRI